MARSLVASALMLTRRSCLLVLTAALALAGCASNPPPAPAVNPADVREFLERAVPRSVPDRGGWMDDIYASLTVLNILPTPENICAVTSVIQQESGFVVDPVIPNLSAIAWKQIDSRAALAHVPRGLVHSVLQWPSPDGRSYGARIDAARTEKQLSDIYEAFIASVPLGSTLFAERNPIRTRGPMQVNVMFAEQFSATTPYPYPKNQSIADELFTRRGSLYFGTAHLLDYRAPYDAYIYRFADYNAGQYASRNAAFQRALSIASGIALKADGALLPHDANGNNPGSTEVAALALAPRIHLRGVDVRNDLQQGKTQAFEQTALYQRVLALAQQRQGHAPPAAALPLIKLSGPKLQRSLTTAWYAQRVEQRFQRCLQYVRR